MPERIPQSATIRVPLQAYLASDHVSAATGKTIVITISKNGGAYGNPSGGATNAVEIGSGSYYVDLSTTDTATIGPLFIKGTEAATDTIIAIYNVVKATNAGFTALPDAAAEAAGGLYTRGSGAGQIAQAANGQINVNLDTIKTNPVVNAGTVTFPTTATLASTTNITAGTIATVSGNVTGSVGSVTGAVGSVTGLTVSNLDATISSRLAATTALTEAYPAQGAGLTLANALYSIHQKLWEMSISTTTMTVKKRDGSTTAKTATLNSSTSPTAITEIT